MMNRSVLFYFLSLLPAMLCAETSTLSTEAPAPLNPQTQVLPEVPPATNVDCTLKISSQESHIDESLILNWAQQAALQSFSLDAGTVDTQLASLAACFTDQGWSSFNSALQKSGNLDAIKKQNLNLSAQIDGTSKVLEASSGQWKVSVPLQVVYQNDKEKLTQLLSVQVSIGRKPSGDLGIMQMIASPRAKEDTASNMSGSSEAVSNTAPSATSANPSPVAGQGPAAPAALPAATAPGSQSTAPLGQ